MNSSIVSKANKAEEPAVRPSLNSLAIESILVFSNIPSDAIDVESDRCSMRDMSIGEFRSISDSEGQDRSATVRSLSFEVLIPAQRFSSLLQL